MHTFAIERTLPRRRLLFLDFDGVLHPAQGNDVPEFAHAPRLADALRGHTCDIVISSSWRDHYDLRKLRSLLPSDLAHRVVGTTVEDQIGKHCRYHTILASLATYTEPVDWRALDDSIGEFPLDCPELIACDARTGFENTAREALLQWLTAGAN